jgi:hypothetical protein
MQILISFFALFSIIFSQGFVDKFDEEMAKKYTIKEYDSPKKYEITQKLIEDLDEFEYMLFRDGYKRLKIFNVLDTVQNKTVGDIIQMQRQYNRDKLRIKRPYSVAIDAIWKKQQFSSTSRFTRLLCEKSDSLCFDFNEDSTMLDFHIKYSYLDSTNQRNNKLAKMKMQKESKTWKIIEKEIYSLE